MNHPQRNLNELLHPNDDELPTDIKKNSQQLYITEVKFGQTKK